MTCMGKINSRKQRNKNLAWLLSASTVREWDCISETYIYLQTLKPFKRITFIHDVYTKTTVVSLSPLYIFITIPRQLVWISLVLRLCCQIPHKINQAYPTLGCIIVNCLGYTLGVWWCLCLTDTCTEHKINVIFPPVMAKRIYSYARHPANKWLYFSSTIAVFALTIMALSENMDWIFVDDALGSMPKTLAFRRFVLLSSLWTKTISYLRNRKQLSCFYQVRDKNGSLGE